MLLVLFTECLKKVKYFTSTASFSLQDYPMRQWFSNKSLDQNLSGGCGGGGWGVDGIVVQQVKSPPTMPESQMGTSSNPSYSNSNSAPC